MYVTYDRINESLAGVSARSSASSLAKRMSAKASGSVKMCV